jgi:signal recognition particle subunit SRP19
MTEYTIHVPYFDKNLSRSEGREVALDDAVTEPTVKEVATALKQMGYEFEVDPAVSHPREPFSERGCIRVEAEDSKTDVLLAVAAYIPAIRR